MIQLRGLGNMSGKTKASPTAALHPATPPHTSALELTETISAGGLLFAASLADRASADRGKSGNRASVAAGKPAAVPPVLIFVAARWGIAQLPHDWPTVAAAGNCRQCKNSLDAGSSGSHFALTLNVGVPKTSLQ